MYYLLKKNRYWSLSQFTLTHSTSLRVFLFRFTLIFSHLCLGFSSSVFLSDFCTIPLHAVPFPPACTYQLQLISDCSSILYLYQTKHVILIWDYLHEWFPKGAGIRLLTIRFVPTLSVSQPSIQWVLGSVLRGATPECSSLPRIVQIRITLSYSGILSTSY